MRKIPLSLSLLIAAALCVSPAVAADEDFQAWQQLNMSTALRPNVTANMEVQTRFNDDASNFNQLLLRPSLGIVIFDKTVATIGYAYVRTEPANGPDTNENRIWQQISMPLVTLPGVLTLTNRTRLEQRFREDGTSWRLREQLRLVVTSGHPGFDFVGWSEIFFNLNDTDWAGEAGFDRWRNFIGLNFGLSKDVTIEPGYLNQYINRATGDQIDHVFNFTMNVRY